MTDRKSQCREAILSFLEAKATIDALKEDCPDAYREALRELFRLDRAGWWEVIGFDDG